MRLFASTYSTPWYLSTLSSIRTSIGVIPAVTLAASADMVGYPEQTLMRMSLCSLQELLIGCHDVPYCCSVQYLWINHACQDLSLRLSWPPFIWHDTFQSGQSVLYFYNSLANVYRKFQFTVKPNTKIFDEFTGRYVCSKFLKFPCCQLPFRCQEDLFRLFWCKGQFPAFKPVWYSFQCCVWAVH